MRKKEFERRIGELIPMPDANTTADLYQFGIDSREDDFPNPGPDDILTSLEFIAQNFDQKVLQDTYDIIKHKDHQSNPEIIEKTSAALPSEMVAAAIYLQNGCTLKRVAQMAYNGGLECFYAPERPDEVSPLAVCSVIEDGVTHTFYSLHFGSYQPEAVLGNARDYALQHNTSVTQALQYVTADLMMDPGAGAIRKILQGSDPEMTQAMFAIFKSCPAVAAHITYDVDQGQVIVDYNPLWLMLQEAQTPTQPQM